MYSYIYVSFFISDFDASGDDLEGSGRGRGGKIVASGDKGVDDEDAVYSGSGSGSGPDDDVPRRPFHPPTGKPHRPGTGDHKTHRPFDNNDNFNDPSNPKYTVSTKRPASGATSVTSGAFMIVSVLYTVCRMLL